MRFRTYKEYMDYFKSNPVEDDDYGTWVFTPCSGKYDECCNMINSWDEVWPQPMIARKYMPDESLRKLTRRYTKDSRAYMVLDYDPEIKEHISNMSTLEIDLHDCKCSKCISPSQSLIRRSVREK